MNCCGYFENSLGRKKEHSSQKSKEFFSLLFETEGLIKVCMVLRSEAEKRVFLFHSVCYAWYVITCKSRESDDSHDFSLCIHGVS